MQITELEEILTKAFAGEIPISELCLMLSNDRALLAEEQEIVHLLIHFVTDQDLRDKDREYDQHLRAQLEALVAELRREG